MKMYRHKDYEQLKLEMPFGVTLREDNRWVILSKKFPWEDIDREYRKHFKSKEGQVAIPSRLAFGALYIQTAEGYTDEQTRRNIQEVDCKIKLNTSKIHSDFVSAMNESTIAMIVHLPALKRGSIRRHCPFLYSMEAVQGPRHFCSHYMKSAWGNKKTLNSRALY